MQVATQEKVTIELNRIRPLKGQPRQHFDPEGLKRLAASLRAVGQLVPAKVRRVRNESHDFELVDGERRWRACRMAGIGTLWVVEENLGDDAERHFELSAISNFCRADLSYLEVAHIVQWFSNHRGYSAEEIAERLGCTTGWVYQLRAITSLPPAVQKLMHPSVPEKKRLKFSIAYEIAKRVPSDQSELQLELAQFCLQHRVRLAQARALITRRTKGFGTAPQPRAPRPDKALHAFLSFVDRLEADLDIHEHSLGDVQRLLVSRDQTTIRMTLDSLKKSIARMGKLSGQLEGVRK